MRLRPSPLLAAVASSALLLTACNPSPPPATRSAAAATAAGTVVPPATLVRTATVALPGADLALGRPYSMSRPPNYPYCTEAGDRTQLTDGAFAQGYFWVDPATVGWAHTPRIDLVVDLGSIQPIAAIAINTAGGRAAAAKAGVELPDAWFLVSDDGTSFRQVAAFQGYAIPDRPDSYVRRYATAGDLALAGRYVAVVLVPNGPFAFLDEIEVRRGESVRPSNAPGLTLAQFGQVISEQRGALLANLGRARTSTARRTVVRANLAAAGGEAAAALSTLEAATDDLPWLQANARLAANRFPGQELIAWRRDLWQDHAACDLPPAGAETPATLSVVLGCDEYESTGFALTNPGAAPLRITASLGDLVAPGGRIPASDLQVRIAAFSDCRDGLQRPDALPLLDADGAVIDPGCTRQLWLGVHASGQAAGIYRGELALDLPSGRRLFPLVVEVVAVTLPRPLPLATVDWGYLSFQPCKADPEAAIRDKAAHGINTVVLDGPRLPRFTISETGTLTASDYTVFDETVRRHRAAGISRFIFFSYFGDLAGLKYPLGCHVTAPPGLSVGTPGWRTAIGAITTTWIQHCLELGLKAEDLAFYPFDEPSDRQLSEFAAIWAAIRLADPRARCFVTVPEASLPAMQAIAPSIGLWCPHLYRDQARPFDAARLAFFHERQAAGAAFWLYNCEGPDKSFPPLAHYRRLPWQAWTMRATGVGVWNYADTGAGQFTSAWSDLDGSREDFALIYDAASAPAGVSRHEAQIPSRRWEAFRDGLEDYGYLWSLRQAANAARTRGDLATAATCDNVLAEAARLVAADPGADRTWSVVHEQVLRTLAALPAAR